MEYNLSAMEISRAHPVHFAEIMITSSFWKKFLVLALELRSFLECMVIRVDVPTTGSNMRVKEKKMARGSEIEARIETSSSEWLLFLEGLQRIQEVYITSEFRMFRFGLLYNFHSDAWKPSKEAFKGRHLTYLRSETIRRRSRKAFYERRPPSRVRLPIICAVNSIIAVAKSDLSFPGPRTVFLHRESSL